MWKQKDRRGKRDRRVVELGPPKGMTERRMRAERRLPEVTEFEIAEESESVDGFVVDHAIPRAD